MTQASITAEGFEEADRLLEKLELEVRHRALAKATRAAANVVKREARRRAPDGTKSGNSLKKSKSKQQEKNKRLRNSIRVVVRKYKDSTLAVVGADYNKGPHAHLVEDGHAKVLWGHRTDERVEGKKFFAPSVDRTKRQQEEALINSLKKSIESAGG